MAIKRKIDAMHARHGTKPDKVCKDCCNFVIVGNNGKYYKKCIAYGISYSEATDWRSLNLACGLYGTEFNQEERPLIEILKKFKDYGTGLMDGQMKIEM